MKIAHFAPFAPGECGLYEAARDFLRADHHEGHESLLVDTGAMRNNVKMPRQIGASQVRGDFSVVTVDVHKVKDFDVFVMHDSFDAEFLDSTSAPIIKVLHGRPLYCYRQQQLGRQPMFDYYHEESENERIKIWLTMWDEFIPFWEQVFGTEKIRCTGDPPIDQVIYNPEGIVHDFEEGKKGDFNILIADSWREDVDPWEMVHGAIRAGQEIDGLKIHVYGVPQPGPLGAWEHHFRLMRELHIDGEVMARMPNMEQVYRAMDLVLTPHRISTRIPAESMCCGTTVLAANGARYTQFTCDPSDPLDVAEKIKDVQIAKRDNSMLQADTLGKANVFGLPAFGKKMTTFYEEAIKSCEGTSPLTLPTAGKPASNKN